jgi:hypothetical protein
VHETLKDLAVVWCEPVNKLVGKLEDRKLGDRRDVFCSFTLVARLARVVVADLPHHVTQRSNARQSILTTDGERRVYLDPLRRCVSLGGLSLPGYCLMSNHVHLLSIA